MDRYLCASEGAGVMRLRLGPEARIDTLEFGETITIGSAKVSLHPAGHILGSAQVRIEVNGEVAVVSGDYKTEPDVTCSAFQPVKCHLFVTESTFGLPVYRWTPTDDVVAQIHAWWQQNQAAGQASLLMGYALGKAQRALARLSPDIGPIFVHGAVHSVNEAYRQAGVHLPTTRLVSEADKGTDWSAAMIVAPPSADGTPWIRRFGNVSTAFLSGWMAIRGARRRRSVDRGFVMSDHVDWPSLLDSIEATGAERIWVTHGYTSVVVRYLQEQGKDAQAIGTSFEGEQDGNPEGELET
jgi:putative mRNA 3-end processing factor